jgi:hypothetical protein
MTTSSTQFGILIYSFGLINSLEGKKSLSFSKKVLTNNVWCEYKTLLKDSYPLRVDLEKEKMPINISKLCAAIPTHLVCIKPIADLGATICGSIHVGQLNRSKRKVLKTLKPGRVYCLDFFNQHMYLTYDLTRNFVCLACNHTELPSKISC